MVVREQKVDGADQASMHSLWASTTMMSAARSEEEDSSGSSDPQNIPDCGQRKRKSDDADHEKEMKRQKNREAAKRCRDKKQKQTEDLKHKNSELEKENCQLAKQRDELIRKCREYQNEIDQHKQQGCVVPHFNPPYNLDHLLQPSSPPSPSFSESAPSTSSCPSPAPSISPGPPARYPPSVRADLPHQLPLHDDMSSGGTKSHAHVLARGTRSNTMTSVPTSTSLETTQVISDSNQLHYLRVRNKDGSHKILCLDHENYLKVMHKLKAQRAAAAKNTQSEPVQSPTSACTVTPNSQSQQISSQQEQSESQTTMNIGLIQPSSQVEEQEAGQKSGQKLDTCEDLLSILKTHVKDTGNGFELTPVSEDEVSIKQEPLDVEYELKSFDNIHGQIGLTGIKQEEMMMPESLGNWTSTGQQIRTSLDTLTNQDDLSSPSARIQNIVQYLERDEHTVPVTVSGTSTAQQQSQRVRQDLTTQTPSARSAHMATYVTSSASVGALSKMNAGTSHTSSLLQQTTRQQVSNQVTAQQQNRVPVTLGQQQSLVIPSMQTVKIRPNAASLVTSASMSLVGKSLSLVSSPTLAAHRTGQEAPRINAVQASRADVTSSSNVTAETRPRSSTGTSLSAGSVQTTQGIGNNIRMQVMPGQQLGPTPSLQALQQDSAIPFQHRTSSTIDTSPIAPLHLQDVAPTDNLMSESTSQIAEYLQKNSIETMDS